MHWQYSPYVFPLVIAAAMSTALAIFAWRRRPASGAAPVTLLMLAVAMWQSGYALELSSADLPSQLSWGKLAYLGMVMVPTTWLVFVLQYTGRERWLTRRNLALLAIEPLVTLLLVCTNQFHGLIYSKLELHTYGSFVRLDETFGAWAWVDVAYSYLLLGLGTLLLIQAFIRSPHLYRRQIGVLLIGAFAPWAAEVLSMSGLSPFPHLDLTPLAFTWSGLAATWGLFRYRLLDIVPVARDAVIESMGDGVMVLDAQNRVVDLNPAAQRFVGCSAAKAIGQPIRIADWELRIADLEGQGFHSELRIPQPFDEVHPEPGRGAQDESVMTCDLRISPLHDRHGRLTGRLVVLRDITERKRTEEELREHREHLEELVAARTAELREANEALQREIAERKRVFEQVQAGREQLARLTQQVVSAQEEERQRLSRELHDEAGQALTALKIGLELIQSDLPVEAGSLRQRLGEAVVLTETTMEQVRLLAHDLRPPALDTVGLNYTLEGLCHDFAERIQLPAHYVGTELPALPEAVKICLYRFLQEALTNVAKHAQANQVTIALHCDAETVSLSVADDGKGFDEQCGMSAGIGLLGMRERLEVLGGKLDIESGSGQGTRLVARIPLQKAYLERRRARDSRHRR
jgi:PAS domain S-box-containing protein